MLKFFINEFICFSVNLIDIFYFMLMVHTLRPITALSGINQAVHRFKPEEWNE